jgi:uncharacterized RDD family membrane protein YckC
MQNKEKGQPRYVWDPQKLAWVETTEELAQEVPQLQETVEAQTAVEEQTAEITAKQKPIDAIPEVGQMLYVGALIRLAAVVIDFIILSLITFIISRISSYPAWVLPIVGLIYFVGFWTWRGQTPGKMIVRAKIVKNDGGPINIVNAIVRFLFYIIPSFTPIAFLASPIRILVVILPILAIIIVAVTGQKRGLHDLIAGTFVISTRSSATLQPEAVEQRTSDAVQPKTDDVDPIEQK